ncbi:allantoinase AllB [Acuticoccus mangrovi]|uniref:Allantoinase AllB n=1 Tax=Acuticoccus mangrovi TaxID=2796142 RepID=A0A934IIQ1_9HYPH|nr:allantoinase AllB [Acuticoccus mangrovi]MBJ3774437.1 allantoinase AllB [Acuticoccus mangrovi]
MNTFYADTVLTGGTVVSDRMSMRADVAIRDGIVTAVGAPETMPMAEERVDVSGLYLIPGAIDVHVHFREPGYTHKEDWETGSAAAAMGGVTTIFEMPNTDPPTRSIVELRGKLACARKSYVDFGIYGLLAEDNLDEIPGLIDGGVAAFKCFMGNTFGDLPSPSTGAMLEGFQIIARSGLRISLHAETASIMARRQAQLEEAGLCAPTDHIASRPDVVAVEAVGRAAALAQWAGARIHILHISSAAELVPLMQARARGVDVTGETCPHYLLLDRSDYARVGSVIRVNPPVRERRDAAALWDALDAGMIDMIATDHAPHTPEEKRQSNIWRADCGFPGVETQMPLMLTEVAKGRMTLERYVAISSAVPARKFGLWPAKGRIAVGADADIAVIDPTRRETIEARRLHSRGKITPFEGRQTVGAPVHTLVRGAFVQRDRQLVAERRGHGLSVSRIQRMPDPMPRNDDQAIDTIIAMAQREAESVPVALTTSA